MDLADGFWVFGYGSLIWNPGFEPDESVLATLSGYHRSFCMASIVYRGTPEDPGLVLALDRQDSGTCEGLAYHVPAATAEEVLAYLRERELVSSAYKESVETLELADGREVQALCYVMDREHDQYRGHLTLADQAEIIARAAGPAGSNRDYLLNTVQSLSRLGLKDAELNWLADEIGRTT
ncbi:gamma-glutamylcyclotransferase [Algicella marina]|uniref:glutathione-specific gamma-glutamylcyclotransferase n=1 Tax=Algicella marina TaxID=2683284 RepID=A0A6P1SSU5_9RHOB|nr:gamma-glutamylcyclotransferase [Algicella marina]QHQ33744.1 gamma-glutamylcyclotransferase [Algicella marina]